MNSIFRTNNKLPPKIKWNYFYICAKFTMVLLLPYISQCSHFPSNLYSNMKNHYYSPTHEVSTTSSVAHASINYKQGGHPIKFWFTLSNATENSVE